MDESHWTLKGENKACALTFKNPETENLYLSLRSNKVVSLFPKLLMAALCLSIAFRRVRLLVAAATGGGSSTFSQEIRLFCVTIGLLLIELVVHCWQRLANFRCTLLVLLFFYTAADGSLTYYQSRVKDEPVYAFRYFYRL